MSDHRNRPARQRRAQAGKFLRKGWKITLHVKELAAEVWD